MDVPLAFAGSNIHPVLEEPRDHCCKDYLTHIQGSALTVQTLHLRHEAHDPCHDVMGSLTYINLYDSEHSMTIQNLYFGHDP